MASKVAIAPAIGALILLISGPARAQDFSGPLSPGAFEATLNMGPIANALRENRTRAAPTVQPPAAPTDAMTWRYVPSKTRRKAFLDGFLARARKQNPADAERLAALFAQGDIIERFDLGLRPFGVRIDDVADVYSIWSISLWQASRGDTSTPSKQQVAAVRRQTATALGQAGILRGASDATKQELVESMLLQTAFVDAGMEQAKGDPAKLRNVRAAAEANAKAMGLDITALSLTEQGFAER